MINLTELMNRRQETERPVPPPDVDAVALRDALAAYERPARFSHGEVLRFKPGLACNNSLTRPMIFVRYLPAPVEPNREETFHGPWFYYDCVIAMRDDDGDLMFGPTDSRRLEIWEGI